MHSYFHECFFVFLIFLNCSHSDPIVIQTLKKGDQYEDTNNFGISSNQGITNVQAEAGFNNANEKKLTNAITNVRYGEQNNNKNDHLDANNFNQGAFYQKDGANSNDFEDKKVHQKGHHRNGFHNTYHKDEVGSNSSFYDDGSDEGGHHIRKSDKGSYGNALEDNKHGNHIDSSHHANQGTNQGQFDNVNMYDRDAMNNQNYNHKQHFDDRRQADQRGGSYGSEGLYNEQGYARPPPYYNKPIFNNYDSYNRGYPRKRITIYEDPRYNVHPEPVRYNDDFVELDVRPARRHFDRRRPYDY